MKHLKLAMICLGLALTAMVVTEADAGRIKKPPKGSRTEKTEDEMKPVRIAKLPPMEFVGGTLTQDLHTGWKIGNTPLYLGKNCVISSGEGDGVMLVEGLEAVVMGTRFGNAINARSIVLSRSIQKSPGGSYAEGLKEVGPNPNVGVYSQRPD